jgi:Zn-dependent protease
LAKFVLCPECNGKNPFGVTRCHTCSAIIFEGIPFEEDVPSIEEVARKSKNPYFFSWRRRAGCIAGFPLYIHLSVLLWFVLPFLCGSEIDSMFTALILVLSILVHELSHAFVCWLLGLGKGSITIWFFGGYFIPVDIDSLVFEMESGRKLRYVGMLAAGPASNLIIASIAALVASGFQIDLAQRIAEMNLAFGVFNLMPIPRLDGGTILLALGSLRFPWRIVQRILGFAIIVLVIGSFFVMPEALGASWQVFAIFSAIYAIRYTRKSDDDIRDEFKQLLEKERDFIGV